jgi:hypothetical protein
MLQNEIDQTKRRNQWTNYTVASANREESQDPRVLYAVVKLKSRLLLRNYIYWFLEQ